MGGKELEVLVDSKFGVASLHKGLKVGTSKWDADPRLLTILVGILTAPPRYSAFSLSNFWAYLRYLPAIDHLNPALKLGRLWSDVDSHQKTILSDDFGMALPNLYMIDKHGFKEIVDTKWFAAKFDPGLLGKIPKKKGPAKSADFVCRDASGLLHLLECKGTQTSRYSMDGLIEKGVSQKIIPSTSKSHFSSRMVSGAFVPQSKSKEFACIKFVDPEEDGIWLRIFENDPASVARAIKRIWFSKLLAAAGLRRVATAVYDGFSMDRDRGFLAASLGELRFAGFEPSDDQFRLDVEHQSFDNLGESDDLYVPMTNRLRVSIQSAMVSRLAYFVVSNGLQSIEFCEWLDEMSSATISTSDGPADAKLVSGIRLRMGTESASLITAYGVEFEISRLPFA